MLSANSIFSRFLGKQTEFWGFSFRVQPINPFRVCQHQTQVGISKIGDLSVSFRCVFFSFSFYSFRFSFVFRGTQSKVRNSFFRSVSIKRNLVSRKHIDLSLWRFDFLSFSRLVLYGFADKLFRMVRVNQSSRKRINLCLFFL